MPCVGDTRACYDGAANTRHVGVCSDGTQTYQANATWTSCSGETLPNIEVCGNAVDENCDGSAPSCSGSFKWADRFGGAGEEYVRSVADPHDSSGDSIITGTFTSTVDFGNGSVASSNGRDIFLVRLDPDGKPRWTQYLQGKGDQFAISVTANPNTNRIYVTGYFQGKFTFNGNLIVAGGTQQDVFLATYDATTGAPISIDSL